MSQDMSPRHGFGALECQLRHPILAPFNLNLRKPMINNSGVQIRVTTYSKISFSSWQWLQPQGGKEWTGEEP